LAQSVKDLRQKRYQLC
jgi:hypothetical protein